MKRNLFQNRRGAALVIVLIFVVLLAGLVIAYFSRSMTDRKLSDSSLAGSQADQLARSALDIIVSGLKQEIANGSNATTVGVAPNASTVYAPLDPANSVPVRHQPAGGADGAAPSPIPNLVRSSMRNDPIAAPAVASMASPLSSTSDPSLNGRFISLARWNKHLLIPRKNPASQTDATPVDSFVAPDWVFVTGKGPAVLTAPDPDVIGRYAFAIYDEGGLLDVNVAGFPSIMAGNATTSAQVAGKVSVAYADLTQLGLSAAEVDAIVGWRNHATLQAGGTFGQPDFSGSATAGIAYAKHVAERASGRAQAATMVWNGRTDQAVLSRQQLLGLQRSLGFNASALQYLGTFSRSLDQPALAPPAGRPTVVSDIGKPPYSTYGGGNDGFGNDNAINPAFLSVRVAGPFTRNDGTEAVAGEPLVKKRFALENLAWLTYKGPSAGRSTSDPDLAVLLKNPGVTDELLARGTPENIRKVFGLVWKNGVWEYAPTGTIVPGAIARLSDVSGREPNFFELLKAAIQVGSLGKSVGANGQFFDNTKQQGLHIFYSSVDFHIMKLAANIIDQADADGFPTRICFDAGVGPRYFSGIENLPYFYRLRHLVVRAAEGAYKDSVGNVQTVPAGGNSGTVPGTLTYQGRGVLFILPEVWNPHDQNSASGTPRPTRLRAVADNVIDFPTPAQAGGNGLDSSATFTVKSGPRVYQGSGGQSDNGFGDHVPAGNFPVPQPVRLTPDNSALMFTDNAGALFREPTSLRIMNSPPGSNLAPGPKHQLRDVKSTAGASFLVGATGSSLVLPDGSIHDVRDNPSDPGKVGFYIGTAPLFQQVTNPAGGVAGTVGEGYVVGGTFSRWQMAFYKTSGTFTFRMQYEEPAGSGNWVDYDTKFWDLREGGDSVDPREAKSGNLTSRAALWSYAGLYDPRTGRFGIGLGRPGGSSPNLYSPTLSPKRLTDATDNASSFSLATMRLTYGDTLGSNRPAYNVFDSYPITNPVLRTANGPGFVLPSSSMQLDMMFSQNNQDLKTYYPDADGVVRKGMSAFTPVTNNATASDLGLPTTVATSYSGSGSSVKMSATAQSQSRPIVLNRPFRSVAELGSVFRDIPWKNLDFFTPGSADAGLLDVFCISGTANADGLVAGKVNLNTRQPLVLQAILAGAGRDEQATLASPPAWQIPPLAEGEAATLAARLVARTTGEAVNGQDPPAPPASGVAAQPLANMSELVGRWVSGNGTSARYEGFAMDVQTNPTATAGQVIQRFREAAVRPLAGSGQTRVWNLLIDVVAQTGKFAPGASTLRQFHMESETRRWLHVAIDRATGKVIDVQQENITE